MCIKPFHEHAQAPTHHIVVILTLCIKAEGGLAAGRHIVERQADNSLHTWVEKRWLEPHLHMAGHIVHACKVPQLHPPEIVSGKRFLHGCGLHHPTCNKAQARSLGFYLLLSQTP